MVELREIIVENLEDFLEENTTEDQSEFIDSNIYGLAEACQVMNSDNNLSRGYSVFYNGKEIGYIMVVYQPKDMDNPEDYDNSYYMSRLLIDKRYKGWGIREKAEEILSDLIKQEISRCMVMV